MRLKNRILAVLCTVIATVSFLYPFSGKYVYAEPGKEEAAAVKETEEGVYAAARTETETGGQETAGQETETGGQEAEAETAGQETETAGQKTETDADAQKENAREMEAAGQEEAKKGLPEKENQKTAERGWSAQEETAGAEAAAEKNAEETAAGGEGGQSGAVCIVENDTQDTAEERIVAADGRYAAGRAMEASGRSIGISEKSPQSGQQNRYDAVGAETAWTVPADGYYDLYCYGAQGGAGDYRGKSGSSGEGKEGDAIGRRYFLKKGTTLSIQAGSQPQRSVAEGFGEGSTNGNPEKITEYGYSREIWKHRKNTDYGVGTIWQYRGYPDGGYGDYKMTICNNVGSHSGGSDRRRGRRVLQGADRFFSAAERKRRKRRHSVLCNAQQRRRRDDGRRKRRRDDGGVYPDGRGSAKGIK